MKISRTPNFIEIHGVDNSGQFSIRILRDCSQIQLNKEYSDEFVDVDYNELTEIRNVINEVLEGFEKEHGQ